MTITEILPQLENYPGRTVVRVIWTDGNFGLMLVDELRVALREGEVFGRSLDEIESVEFFSNRHLTGRS